MIYPIIELCPWSVSFNAFMSNLREETQADLPGVEIPLLEYGRECLHKREDQTVTETTQER